MWPAIALVFASLSALLAALWFLDRRRSWRERSRLHETVSLLSEQTRDLSAGEKSRQQTLFDGPAPPNAAPRWRTISRPRSTHGQTPTASNRFTSIWSKTPSITVATRAA